MVARFIFLPIEENGYLFFTQMLTRGKLAQHQEEVREKKKHLYLGLYILAILEYKLCEIIKHNINE